jgi:7-cyano-7-deazaguanine synthase
VNPALVLLSGGLDSATVLAVALAEGRDCHCLTFRYGQRHAAELDAARIVADALGAASHRFVDIDLRAVGGSALTDDALDVPTDSPEGIPITYVPARNTLFLAYALAYAEVADARELWIGVNAVDYSGYPDCRPEFIDAFETLANLATRSGVESAPEPWFRMRAPLMHKSKAEIVRWGVELGVDYAITHSCYDPPDADGRACGACDSCRLRRNGFVEAGMDDPTLYA